MNFHRGSLAIGPGPSGRRNLRSDQTPQKRALRSAGGTTSTSSEKPQCDKNGQGWSFETIICYKRAWRVRLFSRMLQFYFTECGFVMLRFTVRNVGSPRFVHMGRAFLMYDDFPQVCFLHLLRHGGSECSCDIRCMFIDVSNQSIHRHIGIMCVPYFDSNNSRSGPIFLAGGTFLRAQYCVKESPLFFLAAIANHFASIQVRGLLRLHSECNLQAPSPAGSSELKPQVIRRRSHGQVCRPHDPRSLPGNNTWSANLWSRLLLIRLPLRQEPQPQVRPRRVLL